jgi:hypothetical protein
MKTLLVAGGDAAACLGIITSIFHVLPEVVGVLAGSAAFIWYAIQIWQSLKKKASS